MLLELSARPAVPMTQPVAQRQDLQDYLSAHRLPSGLALRKPLFTPLLHLLDLPLLGAYDVLCELLYLRIIAVFEGYLSHLYGRPVVWDHGVYERLVEGLLVRKLLRVHHAHTPHLLLAHLHGHLRGPKLFLLYGLELLDLGPLTRDDVVGELLYLLVLRLLEGDFGHRNSALVMRNHRVYKALVGVLAVLHDHLP